MKNILFILGMHRSGTSALARSAKALGAKMDDVLIAGNEDNPKGYWENADVVSLNRALFNVFGCDQNFGFKYNIHEVPKKKILEMAFIRSEIVTLLKDKAIDNETWAVKDPRLSLLLSVWKDEIDELGDIQTKALVSIRNPHDVYLSLKRRNGFDIPTSLFLWLKYYYAIAHGLGDTPALLVDYKNLIHSPNNEMSRIARFLDKNEQEHNSEVEKYISGFLDKKLNHGLPNSDNFSSFDSFPEVAPVYKELQKLAEMESIKQSELKKATRHISDSKLINFNSVHFTTQNLQAQLFLNTGHGYSEEDSLSIPFPPEATSVEFELERFPIAQSVRFDPCSEICIIRLLKTEIHHLNSTIQEIYPKRGTFLTHDGDLFVFNTDDPQFEYDIDHAVRKIVFSFNIIATGHNANNFILPRLTRKYSDLIAIFDKMREDLNSSHENQKITLQKLEQFREQSQQALHERDEAYAKVDDYKRQLESANLHNDYTLKQAMALVDRAEGQLRSTIKDRNLELHLEAANKRIDLLKQQQEDTTIAHEKAEAERDLATARLTTTQQSLQKQINENLRLQNHFSKQVRMLSTLAGSPEWLYSKKKIEAYKRIPLLGRIIDRKVTSEAEKQIIADSKIIEKSGLFDKNHYKKEKSDISIQQLDPIAHYCRFGWKEGKNPSQYFNTTFYLSNYPDVAYSGLNPFAHYIRFGKAEGRLPSIQHMVIDEPINCVFLFDSIDQRGKTETHSPSTFPNDDGGSDAVDTVDTQTEKPDSDIALIIESGLFDEQYYLKQNPDVAESKVEPLRHYFAQGWKENRDPSQFFNTAFYLKQNIDVKESGINPLLHYITNGKLEGRSPKPDSQKAFSKHTLFEIKKFLKSDFNKDYYLDSNPDVKAAGVDPLEHYIQYGWKEGRDPNPNFSTRYYLSKHPHLEDEEINPLYDWIKSGKKIDASLPGGFRHRILIEQQSLNINFERHGNPSGLKCISINKLISRFHNVFSKISEKLVIAFSHDNYTEVVGGVQLCLTVEQEAYNKKGYNFLQVHPAKPTQFLLPPEFRDSYFVSLVANGRSIGICKASDLLTSLKHFIREEQIVIEHLIVHSLLGHSTHFLMKIADELQFTETIFWIHDYYSICPCHTLMRNNIDYCNGPNIGSPACGVCIYGEERDRHSALISDLFIKLQFKVVSPSDFALNLWIAKTGLPYRGTAIIPHCIFNQKRIKAKSASICQKTDRPPIRIAFLGYPAVHKGWPVFCELVSSLEGDSRYKFYHLGNDKRFYPACEFRQVSVGIGNRSAMIDEIQKEDIDYVFIWSLWPETFCFAALEAIASGAIIITNKTSGNVTHTISMNGRGLIYENESELLEAFHGNQVCDYLELSLRDGIPLGNLIYSDISASTLTTPER